MYLSLPEKLLSVQTSFNLFLRNLHYSPRDPILGDKTSPNCLSLSPPIMDLIRLPQITVYLIWHWIFLITVSPESGGVTVSPRSPNGVATFTVNSTRFTSHHVLALPHS